jgi:hypothetical protein
MVIRARAHSCSQIPIDAALELRRRRNRLVATKPLAHVDHAFLAVAEAALELLALFGEFVEEWGREAVEGFVVLDQDAVGLLEAGGEGGA